MLLMHPIIELMLANDTHHLVLLPPPIIHLQTCKYYVNHISFLDMMMLVILRNTQNYWFLPFGKVDILCQSLNIYSRQKCVPFSVK